ncbi:hypothetical protein C8P66_10923 [Humitalea rosea]|uniref:Uncharacterized protein n=1 Tax=Humitalea rosea TaxID=990373 RepID=A0A2W7J4H3_9PROT|nr:hypothetical protein C8P66_10923 [Humitalea rosea]
MRAAGFAAYRLPLAAYFRRIAAKGADGVESGCG